MSLVEDKPMTPPRRARQIPAVGPLPDVETLFVGALLWSAPADVVDVLAHLRDADLSNPVLRRITTVIREVVDTGASYTPVSVLDRLERRDGPRTAVRKALTNCITSGAASCPDAVRVYACVVVSGSLRRCLESGGRALEVAADGAVEGELAPLAGRVADAARNIAERLEALRGEAL